MGKNKKLEDITFKPEIKIKFPHRPTMVHQDKRLKKPKYNNIIGPDDPDDDPNDPINVALYELRRTFKKSKKPDKSNKYN